MDIQDPTPSSRVKTAHIVTFAFCTAIMAILCTAAGFLFAVLPGLPLGFCPAVPVMVPFALWFGGWGVAAAYIGCAIGGIVKGTPVIVALPWVINDVFMAGIPLLAFRYLKADPELKTKRDWVIFIVFGIVVNSLIACTWGTWIPGTRWRSFWMPPRARCSRERCRVSVSACANSRPRTGGSCHRSKPSRGGFGSPSAFL